MSRDNSTNEPHRLDQLAALKGALAGGSKNQQGYVLGQQVDRGQR